MRSGLLRGLVTALVAVATVPAMASSAAAQQATPCDFQSQGDYSGSYSKVTKKGPFDIGEQEIVELESDVDGASIQIGLVKPKVPAGKRVPVIVAPSVYYHSLQTMDLRACRPFLTENYVPHGYAVAFLPVRGTADAGGCMEMMGPNERADIDQAITWLGEQPWSTGAVGMIGKSYDGAAQWEAATFGNPHLKTIVPASGVPDLFELLYGDGIVDWRGPAILNGIYYVESVGFYAPGRSPEHTVEVTGCPTYEEGAAASSYSGATGELDPLGYWAERRYIKDIIENYRGSVYLVQGLQDWNVNPAQQFPWIWDLEREGVYVKYLLGQWGHSWPYDGGSRLDWADILLNWWDRWLKGDRKARLGPRVQVEDQTGKWRNASRWPLGKEITLHLNPGHALDAKSSSESAAELVANDPFHTQLGYDSSMPPAGMESQCVPQTCTYFESAPVERDLRISGMPHLDLTVVPQGPGGQLSAYLYSATDDGYERIGWAQANLRFPGESDEPKDVAAGAELKVGIDMQPLEAVVPKGGRLFLVVSGGTGWNRLPILPASPVEIHEGGGASTFSFIQASPRARDFFSPPE